MVKENTQTHLEIIRRKRQKKKKTRKIRPNEGKQKNRK